MHEALEHAKSKLGGASELARRLSEIGKPITSQAISQWRRVPAERALDVERLTGVLRSELRPDLWPPEEDQHSPKAGDELAGASKASGRAA